VRRVRRVRRIQVCDIIGHKYFQPIQSAKEAEALLSENSSFGTFLFRFSSHPGDYAVSCTCPPRVGRVCRVSCVVCRVVCRVVSCRISQSATHQGLRR
jgi:hypothetical protein